MTRGAVAGLAAGLLGLAACGDEPPSPTTAPPAATTVAGPVTSAPGTVATTTTTTTTTTTLPPSAPGLEALLAGPADLPVTVTPIPATRPANVCGVPLLRLPIDARARGLVDATGAVTITSSVEVHSGAPAATDAFRELATVLGGCDWARELAAQPRPTQLAAQFVDAPELVAGLARCDQAVRGNVVRTTSDDAPVERLDLVVVVARCGDVITWLRIDLRDLPPAAEHVWIEPLVATVLARTAAAA